MTGPNMSRVESIWTRRSLLRFAGLSGAAALLPPGVARGDDAPATRPALDHLHGAGFYRFKVGTIEATLVSDGQFLFSPPFPLFGENASQQAVKQALADVSVPYDHTVAHVNALLLKIDGDYTLIDAGCGAAFGPTTGFVARNLARAGVKPAEIKNVILTHAHVDHYSGLLDGEGGLAFPNARHFVNPVESAFWTGEAPDFSKSGVPAEARPGFIEGARAALAAIKSKTADARPGQQILPGVEVVALPGHTPGHIGLMITSGPEKLFYITDLAHQFGISMQHPEWFMGYDTDRELGAKTRRSALATAAESKVLVSGSHLPFPGVGYVLKAGEAFRWQPKVWEW